MSQIDLRAIPHMVPPPDVVASIARTPDEWAEAIAALRPRLLALGYRELCGLMREMYLQDLFCLVVNAPYSHELLAHLQKGLTEPVWEGLRKDCEKQGEALLGNFAAGVYGRVNEVLVALEASRATKDQLAQLQDLSRQMLALDADAFKRSLDGMPITAIDALFVVTGGLESEWSQRTLGVFSERAREMVREDYPDKSATPIKAEDAADCIENLPRLMAGQPWPEEVQLSPDEMDAWHRRMEKLLETPKTGWREKMKERLLTWKWERMNSYYEIRDWLRSIFGSTK
jgi:hypothetical protein